MISSSAGVNRWQISLKLIFVLGLAYRSIDFKLQAIDALITASMQRKIIHVDMDCFYAAIEMRDNPAYRDIPLAVGGAPDQRGVISTCNYIAREFGVHSAMSRLMPSDYVQT